MDQTGTDLLAGIYFNGLVLGVLVAWLVLAAVVGAAAHSRGRNAAGWFLLAILISPLLALIAVVLIAPGGGARKPCPECGERVPVDARICHYCRHDFGEAPKPDLPDSNWQDAGTWQVVEANDTDEVAVGDQVLVGLGPSQLLLVKPEGRTPQMWLPYDEVAIGLGNDGRVRLSDTIAYLAALEHVSGPDAKSLVESVRAQQQVWSQSFSALVTQVQARRAGYAPARDVRPGSGRVLAVGLGSALVIALAALAVVASGILSPRPSDAAMLWCSQDPGAVLAAAQNLNLDLQTDILIGSVPFSFDSVKAVMHGDPWLMINATPEFMSRWQQHDSGTYNRACQAAFDLR